MKAYQLRRGMYVPCYGIVTYVKLNDKLAFVWFIDESRAYSTYFKRYESVRVESKV